MKTHQSPNKSDASETSAGEQMIAHLIDQSGLPQVAAEISRELDAQGITDPKIRGEALIAALNAALTPSWSQRLISLVCSSAFWFWVVVGILIGFGIYIKIAS